MNGPSCCIVGSTRAQTIEKHANWLSSWGSSFCDELTNALSIVDLMRMASNDAARGILAHGFRMRMMNIGLLPDGVEPNSRPLSQQYKEAATAISKEKIPIDTWVPGIKSPEEIAKYPRQLTLEIIPRPVTRTLGEDMSKDVIAEMEAKYVADIMNWWPAYIAYLNGRFSNNTIDTEYTDTVYMPESLVAAVVNVHNSVPFESDSDDAKKLWASDNNEVLILKSLHDFANRNNTNIKVYYGFNSDSFCIRPKTEDLIVPKV